MTEQQIVAGEGKKEYVGIMSDSAFRGVLTSPSTPFRPNGGIDVASFQRVVGFCVECGAQGLVPCQIMIERLWRGIPAVALGQDAPATNRQPVDSDLTEH